MLYRTCMNVRLGHCTTGISNSWRTFACVPSIPNLASAGKTISQTLRSWNVQSVPALRPYSSRPSCDGWEMSSGWTIFACPVNCCIESLRLARKSKAALASSTRTLWRKTFSGVGNQPKELKAKASEVTDPHWPTQPPTISRMTTIKDLSQTMNDTTEHALLTSQ